VLLCVPAAVGCANLGLDSLQHIASQSFSLE
jgi:hypothetical protein